MSSPSFIFRNIMFFRFTDEDRTTKRLSNHNNNGNYQQSTLSQSKNTIIPPMIIISLLSCSFKSLNNMWTSYVTRFHSIREEGNNECNLPQHCVSNVFRTVKLADKLPNRKVQDLLSRSIHLKRVFATFMAHVVG